jgi:hypothetical protein
MLAQRNANWIKNAFHRKTKITDLRWESRRTMDGTKAGSGIRHPCRILFA